MKERSPYQTLLETTVVNSTGLALLMFFWFNSWLSFAVFSDITYITVLIMILTVIAVSLSTWKSIEIDCELKNELETKNKLDDHSKINPEVLKVLFAERLSILTFLSTTVIMLGLIGTVIGFIVGLHGLDSSMMRDINSMVSSVVQILLGMSIAFYTTLAGAIAHLWIESNLLVLNRSLTCLYQKRLDEFDV
jgi:biopolymer transport protein ExbB/TolQ